VTSDELSLQSSSSVVAVGAQDIATGNVKADKIDKDQNGKKIIQTIKTMMVKNSSYLLMKIIHLWLYQPDLHI